MAGICCSYLLRCNELFVLIVVGRKCISGLQVWTSLNGKRMLNLSSVNKTHVAACVLASAVFSEALFSRPFLACFFLEEISYILSRKNPLSEFK